MHAGVGRRTAVRGAAWTVPVIAVAAAAPAYALSAGLTLTGFTATYLNTANVATVNPASLVVNATLGNTGPQTTIALTCTLTIPAGLYHVRPTATTPAGWNAPTISPTTGTGPWTLVFTAPGTGQIPTGGSKAFSTTISFADPVTTPFRRWAGNAFVLAGSATATNAVPQSASAGVARTVDSPISWGTSNNDFSASLTHGFRARVRIDDLWNGGGSTIGRFRIRVNMAKPASGLSIFANGAQVQPQDIDPKWTFVESNAETTPNGPWYWIFETVDPAFSPAGNRGGGNDTDGPPPGPSFQAYLAPRDRGLLDVNIGLAAGRNFVVSADHATTRTLTF